MTQTVKQGSYAGFLETLIGRFEERLKRVRTVQNFEHGDEFEIAICEVLRDVMPSKVGVCRGYVVAQNGTMAGDDIVLFDRSRFPTLRLLGTDLALKEHVPADAVLAYIEAKHTLYLDPTAKQKGQSLAKAVSQIKQVKALPRNPVPLNQVGRMTLGAPFGVARQPGTPTIRNPYFAAIWALNINCGKRPQTVEAFLTAIHETVGSLSDVGGPDVVAAGNVLACPAFMSGGHILETRAILSEGCQLTGSVHESRCLALSLFQILWAIEEIHLHPIEWGRMLTEELNVAKLTISLPPKAEL